MNPSSLRSISWAVCLELYGNFSTNQRAGNGQNLAEGDQSESAWYEEFHNIYRIWNQSPRQFVQKMHRKHISVTDEQMNNPIPLVHPNSTVGDLDIATHPWDLWGNEYTHLPWSIPKPYTINRHWGSCHWNQCFWLLAAAKQQEHTCTTVRCNF